MIPEPNLPKAELRRQLSLRVKQISAEQRQFDSERARQLLRSQPSWSHARSILFYVPMVSELDLLPLLEECLAAGKSVALPRFIPDTGAYGAFQIRDFQRDCAPGKYGIAEPQGNCPAICLNLLDFILVPGVGFDPTGHRLGRGKGYYDRLLAQASGIKCGIAYNEQISGQIPVDDHDVLMNCILTPTRWITCSS